MLDQGDHVVVTPGTTKLTHLQTNLGAFDCRLTDDDRTTPGVLADKVIGERHTPEGLAAVNL